MASSVPMEEIVFWVAWGVDCRVAGRSAMCQLGFFFLSFVVLFGMSRADEWLRLSTLYRFPSKFCPLPIFNYINNFKLYVM